MVLVSMVLLRWAFTTNSCLKIFLQFVSSGKCLSLQKEIKDLATMNLEYCAGGTQVGLIFCFIILCNTWGKIPFSWMTGNPLCFEAEIFSEYAEIWKTANIDLSEMQLQPFLPSKHFFLISPHFHSWNGIGRKFPVPVELPKYSSLKSWSDLSENSLESLLRNTRREQLQKHPCGIMNWECASLRKILYPFIPIDPLLPYSLLWSAEE